MTVVLKIIIIVGALLVPLILYNDEKSLFSLNGGDYHGRGDADRGGDFGDFGR